MSFTEAPTEIFVYIVSKLEHSELRALLCTCKYNIPWSVVFRYRYNITQEVTKEMYLLDLSHEPFHKYIEGSHNEKVAWLRNDFLGLREKKIDYVPKEIRWFSHLKSLDLHNNELKELPKEFKCLAALKEIDLSKNKFTEIPKAIFKLKNLKYLNMRLNRIQEIDARISALVSLEILLLHGNVIKDISSNILNLKKLGHIELNLSTSLMKMEIAGRLIEYILDENRNIHGIRCAMITFVK